MTGGGGGGACAHVVSKRNEDEKLLIAASNRTIIRLAQGAFPGADADDLRRRLGGGRRRHLKVLSLAKAADFDDVRLVKYVAFPGDFPDVRGFVEAGDIGIVAVLSSERPEQFDQDPTALAQGYDVTGPNWRGLYVRKGIADEAGDMWNQPTQQMVASEEFQRIRAEQGIDPLDLLGAAEESVKENVAEIRALSKKAGLIQQVTRRPARDPRSLPSHERTPQERPHHGRDRAGPRGLLYLGGHDHSRERHGGC